ncbi:unnamed protein product [Mortierella alpina]
MDEAQETVLASPDIYQAISKAISNDGGDGELTKAELRQDRRFQRLETMMAKNTELLLAKQEEARLLQEQIFTNQIEMKQMQQQALAVGMATMNIFANKFRLYFLCECGEHTKSINRTTKIPHHIHLAKHERYEIARPSEFFEQYGAYVLTILKMLKYGVTVAGIVMPALSQLITPEVLDDDVKAVTEQVDGKEALEGADLRKLDTFLKHKDSNKVLGNLYRTVTDEGHVKWVCIDHYRMNYQENAAKEFLRVLEAVGG